MAGRTNPPFRRHVDRPQRRQRRRRGGGGGGGGWPRLDRNTKVCGVLVVPVLGIFALLAIWMYVLRQTVRDHVIHYIVNVDQSLLELLVEAGIAIVFFGALLKIVDLVPSTQRA